VQILVLPDGGTIALKDASLTFNNCNGLTVLIAAGTDYAMDYVAHYRGKDPHARVAEQLDWASRKSTRRLRLSTCGISNRSLAAYTGPRQNDRHSMRLAYDQRKLEAFKSADPQIRGTPVSVWPLSADLLLAPRRFAGEFAGPLERLEPSTLA